MSPPFFKVLYRNVKDFFCYGAAQFGLCLGSPPFFRNLSLKNEGFFVLYRFEFAHRTNFFTTDAQLYFLEERGKREEERGKKKEERGKREEGRGKREEGRGKRKEERGKKKEERRKRKETCEWSF